MSASPKGPDRKMNIPMRRMTFVEMAAIALLAIACPGCAFTTGHIPATSTPVREARYYRTQDVQSFAAGIVVDEAARLIFKGPRQCPDTVWYQQGLRAYGTTCNNWAPLLRIATVLAAGGIHRAVSKDYRESSWMFNVSGAMLWEIIRCATSAGCTRPQR